VNVYLTPVFREKVRWCCNTPWRRIGEVEVQLHALLTSALGGDEWSASHPCRFIPGESTLGTNWFLCTTSTRVYPKVSGLAAWSENSKWYSSLTLGAVVSLFCESVSEFCRHNSLCCFSTSVYCCCLFRYRLSPETFGYTLVWYILLMNCQTKKKVMAKKADFIMCQ
jgi:hypothetical protein